MIFVDTGFFYALASKDDPDHRRVAEVFRRYQGQDLPRQLLTSNHVVGETITLAQVKRGHAAAVLIGEQLYAEGWRGFIGRLPKKRRPPSPISGSTKTRSTASWTA